MSQNPIAALIYALLPTNVSAPLHADAQGAIAASEAHGNIYTPTKAGRVMMGANQTGATTSAALATTYTGLCLSNPAASGVNLSLLRVNVSLNVAPAALTAFGLIAGYAAGGVTVHTTPITPFNSFLNGTAPLAKLDAACTLVGTAAWARWLGETPATTSVTTFSDMTNGGIIIPPGGYVAIGTTIAGPTAGLLASFQWEECPQ